MTRYATVWYVHMRCNLRTILGAPIVTRTFGPVAHHPFNNACESRLGKQTFENLLLVFDALARTSVTSWRVDMCLPLQHFKSPKRMVEKSILFGNSWSFRKLVMSKPKSSCLKVYLYLSYTSCGGHSPPTLMFTALKHTVNQRRSAFRRAMGCLLSVPSAMSHVTLTD